MFQACRPTPRSPNPTAGEILDLLRGGERSVGDLVDRLDAEPARRLQAPQGAARGRARRRPQPTGKQRLYALRSQPLAEVDAWLEPYRAFWSNRLDALERHLEENP